MNGLTPVHNTVGPIWMKASKVWCSKVFETKLARLLIAYIHFDNILTAPQCDFPKGVTDLVSVTIVWCVCVTTYYKFSDRNKRVEFCKRLKFINDTSVCYNNFFNHYVNRITIRSKWCGIIYAKDHFRIVIVERSLL